MPLGYDTHVCGILAGDGKASGGRLRGIAPECLCVCGKVLDSKGAGNLKNLLQGLQWIVDIRKIYPIRILNISIELDIETHLDKEEMLLLQKYMELLWRENVIVIAAAGNKGPMPMSISPISESGYSICVGCHDGDYIGKDGKNCAEYSGRGPGRVESVSGIKQINPLKKPDIVAPGTDIISCNNKVIERNHTYYHAYIAKSGTSMATPIVSGTCALCVQKYPELTNIEIRRRLLKTAKDMGQNWDTQGAGMVQTKKFLQSMI